MRDGERRVVVTGMGALTPLGNDVASFCDGISHGRSGCRRAESSGPRRGGSRVAGEIRGFVPEEVMPRKEVRRNDRYVHCAWAATAEALRDADLPNPSTDEGLAWSTGV